ncbi:MAG: type II secretion system F family protein [Hyphomicrobiales bacterium]|nr:type II secretion system F family protein [Hyphomicrobiales bacterium]
MSMAALIPLLIFVAVLLLVIVFYLTVSSQHFQRASMQRRLHDVGGAKTTEGELKRARHDRSLSPEGHYSMPIISLNLLILQSGATVGVQGILFTMAFLAAGSYFIISIILSSTVFGTIGAAVIGIGLPVMALRLMRRSRQRAFEEQLPDALDTLVRGLKAGHSIPIAISTVGDQMPQPLGNEFAMTGAEMTYGLDVETALSNLRSRVGQNDLTLFVLAVTIQAKMGGNLAEILSNLATIIRLRFKLRRKATALSAEGRYSAVFLTLMPIVLFGVLWLIAPNYYGEVWDIWYVKPTLGAALVWMLIGNYVMNRMVKFSI